MGDSRRRHRLVAAVTVEGAAGLSAESDSPTAAYEQAQAVARRYRGLRNPQAREVTMQARTTVVAVFALLSCTVGAAPAFGQELNGTGCPNQVQNNAVLRDYFGPLFDRLGPIAGNPVGCIGEAPDGGASQATTTGLLYARPERGGPLRVIVFTDGHRHWAVDANLTPVTLYWEGEAAYPPAQGVTRQPVPSAVAQAPWPPSPAPTVGVPPNATPASRPATGEHIAPPTYSGGRGQLTLRNELSVDAAFKLRDADGARAARAFVFVRAGEETTLDGVTPGTYQLQIVSGTDWDTEGRIFRHVRTAMQFGEDLTFTERSTDDGITWDVRWVKIYPTDAPSQGGVQIDPAELQKD
jgi:hypothetical protein